MLENLDGNPSPNGANGEPRDRLGRFAPGNRGGPGNPLAAAVFAWRTAIRDAVSSDDLVGVIRAMLAAAKGGDVAAAKLVLEFTIGRPRESIEIQGAQAQLLQVIVGTEGDV